jgi:hypothetical protein
MVAVQHVPFSENSISYFPSNRDIQLNNLPDKLVVIGEDWHRLFNEFGIPGERIEIGGSLRLDTSSLRPVDRAPKVGSTRMVLCCSDFGFDESFELVHKAVAATSEIEDLRLVVNFHPATSPSYRESLEQKVFEMSDCSLEHVEFTEARAPDLIPEADAVLYTTSSAGFDAMACGVAPVFVGRDGDLDQDKMPQGAAQRCRSVADIRHAIEKCLAEDGPEATKRPGFRDLLSCFLGDVNADVWRGIVDG